mmetsp:Transcript_128765/g.222464  ORF Transcript_128765/g.222464 Transcript_128765/m.222464 type:complete len:290 (-) Transcript_128765:56-925(-)
MQNVGELLKVDEAIAIVIQAVDDGAPRLLVDADEHVLLAQRVDFDLPLRIRFAPQGFECFEQIVVILREQFLDLLEVHLLRPRSGSHVRQEGPQLDTEQCSFNALLQILNRDAAFLVLASKGYEGVHHLNLILLVLRVHIMLLQRLYNVQEQWKLQRSSRIVPHMAEDHLQGISVWQVNPQLQQHPGELPRVVVSPIPCLLEHRPHCFPLHICQRDDAGVHERRDPLGDPDRFPLLHPRSMSLRWPSCPIAAPSAYAVTAHLLHHVRELGRHGPWLLVLRVPGHQRPLV